MQAGIKNEKFKQQERQYEFPYHHIPHFDTRTGAGVKSRSLGWGLEYLCYVKHIQDLVLSLNPESALDVGCGDGRFLGLFENQITRRVGVDLAARAIQFAKAFHPEIEFHVLDAADLTETFDVVVCIEVLEHIPDPAIPDFVDTLAKRTKPGGHLVISVPTIVSPVISKHYRHYDLELLKTHLEPLANDFQLIRVDYVHKQHSPFLFQIVQKFIENRFWTLDVYSLRLPLWRYIWEKHRFATARTGRHLVALFQKTST